MDCFFSFKSKKNSAKDSQFTKGKCLCGENRRAKRRKKDAEKDKFFNTKKTETRKSAAQNRINESLSLVFLMNC